MDTLEPFLEIPIEHPSLIFAVVMVLLLIAPLTARKLRLPGIVGLLIAGAIAGPNALGLFERDATFQLLGQVGLVYIMFLAGLEIDINRFIKYKNHSIGFGAVTFLIPQTLGTIAAIYILDMDFLVAVLLASMFASHTLIGYPAISKLGLSKNTAVTSAVGGTIITDTAALLVLAIVLGATAEGGLDAAFWITLVVGLTVYILLVFFTIPKIGRWFFRHVSSEGVLEYVFVLSVVFLAAVLSEVAGVKDIIGAFLAGLALNRLIPESSTLMNRIEFVGNALFIPFFLVSVGMLVDVQVLLEGVDALLVAAVMVVSVILGKFLAAKAGQKVLGQSSDEAMVVFGLTVAQAAATLAVVLVAFDEGLFDEAVLNGAIVMIAVTCFISPMVIERWGKKMAVSQQEGDGGEPTEAPQRFLVPMAYKKTSENLLDMTFALRDHHSEEPVFPLTVVPHEGDTTAQIADAEEMLSEAVVHGSAAEVPVVPLTRVDHNPASGITRAAIERRISDIVVGWKGPGETKRGVFGRVTDQMLEETEQQTMICSLTQPIATFKRVVVVFPPRIEYHQGYSRAIRDIKHMANELGALFTGLCLKDEMSKIRDRVDTIEPELATSFVGFGSMEDLVQTLKRRVEENDLILCLTARKGTVAWTPQLEQMPGRMAELSDYSVAFLYLTDLQLEQMDRAPTKTTASYLSPRRILPRLQADSETEAVQTLLETHFQTDDPQLQQLVEELVSERRGMARELTNETLLLNARSEAISRTRVFFGTFPAGVEAGRDDETIHAIFIVLSPMDTPLQKHLDLFSEVGNIVTRIGDIDALGAIDDKVRLLEEIRRLAADKSASFPARREVADLRSLQDIDGSTW